MIRGKGEKVPMTGRLEINSKEGVKGASHNDTVNGGEPRNWWGGPGLWEKMGRRRLLPFRVGGVMGNWG